MNYLLMLVCSLLIAAGSLFMQQGNKSQQTPVPNAQSDQVEVKTDRFSEATTVKLKPQMILDTPDHFITMRLEAKFGDQKLRDEAEIASAIMSESAFVRFESQSKIPTDFGDKALHFIVDGRRIKAGESAYSFFKLPGPDPDLKPGFKNRETLTNSLKTDELKQIAAGHHVEMRLGKYEFTLTASMLSALQAFVREYVKHALSTKFKEKRS
jgi:hypothetical protein